MVGPRQERADSAVGDVWAPSSQAFRKVAPDNEFWLQRHKGVVMCQRRPIGKVEVSMEGVEPKSSAEHLQALCIDKAAVIEAFSQDDPGAANATQWTS